MKKLLQGRQQVKKFKGRMPKSTGMQMQAAGSVRVVHSGAAGGTDRQEPASSGHLGGGDVGRVSKGQAIVSVGEPGSGGGGRGPERVM